MIRSALAALLIALGSTAAGQTLADGAEPPLNCWTTEDGSPSGARRSNTRPLRDIGAIDWTVELEGEIEGEPLVWEEAVVVAEKISNDERKIHVFNLADGSRRAATKVIKCGQPLVPSIWGKLIIARVGPAKIQSWRIGYTRLYKKWSVEAPAPISRPVVIGREVYVRSNTTLYRYDYGSKKPIWSSSVASFHGTPAIYGDNVYAIAFQSGMPSIAGVFALSRETGVEVKSMGMEFHGSTPPVSEGRVRVGPKEVVAHFGQEIRDGIADLSVSCVPGPPAFGPLRAGPRSLCALFGDRFIGMMKNEALPRPSLVESMSDGFRVLANDELHSDFARADVAPLIVRDVAYLAPAAVQLNQEFYGVLWRLDPALTRFVPARETLLAVRDDDELVAIRSRTTDSRDWRTKIPDGVEARVVLADGQTREAAVKLNGDSLAIHKRKEQWDEYPLDAVTLIEGLDGRLLYWPSTLRAMRGFDVVRDEQRAEGYLELCRKSVRSKDPDLMARYLDAAQRNGVEEEQLTSTRKAEAKERRKKKPSKVKQSVLDTLKSLESELERRPVKLFEARYATLPADAPAHVRFALLRRLTDVDPSNAVAAAAVRAMIPEKIRVEGDFKAGEWIDFVEAIGETPIEIVLPPNLQQPKTTWEERELGSTQLSWRKDIVGVRSERLYIMTPLKNPSSVARCLSLGELVCDALEDMFAAGDVARDERYPLKLFLYESKREYIAESRKRGMGDVSQSLGHYSPGQGVSRMFVPDESDVLNDMLSTYVHELTHHWTAERCPMFSSSASTLENPFVRGFWVVEGFATMVEEFVFDAQARKWHADDPRADSTDTTANSKPNQFIPWKILFGLHQAGLHEFIGKNPQRGLQVPMTWSLGMHRNMSWMNVFYFQSAATCHYLYSDEELRPKLMEYVAKYFTGKTKGLTIEQAFGIPADELGKRVIEYSRKRAAVN